MNRIVKTAVLSAVVVATGLATLPAANARDWHRHHGNGDAVAAGVVGLAAGALLGGALASQPRVYDEPIYDEPIYDEPAYVVRRRPVVREYYRADYAGGLEPWTRDWYAYCSDRYRSFNPRTGTFVGYDGMRHFCAAN